MSDLIQSQTIDLFPDNTVSAITAADLRTFVNNIFNYKEAVIIKIDKISNLGTNNLKIFKDSIVVVYDDGVDTGIYVSNINNPARIEDLSKLSDDSKNDPSIGDLQSDGTIQMSSDYYPNEDRDISNKKYVDDAIRTIESGNPYNSSSAEGFLFDYEFIKNTGSSEFLFNGSEISNISIINSGVKEYEVSFEYLNGVVISKTISKVNSSSKVIVEFNYDSSGVISNKTITRI